MRSAVSPESLPCDDITPADIGVTMKARGLPEWGTEYFEEMYEMFRRGESEFVSDDVRRLSGHDPEASRHMSPSRRRSAPEPDQPADGRRPLVRFAVLEAVPLSSTPTA